MIIDNNKFSKRDYVSKQHDNKSFKPTRLQVIIFILFIIALTAINF